MSLLLALLLTPQDLDLRERWIYCPFDLAVEENVDKLRGIMIRAKQHDYNGIVLEDHHFGKLPTTGPDYLATCRKVKRWADALGLKIIPALFQIGHSEPLLGTDPNLAEALPVEDAPFLVKDGAARLAPGPALSLAPPPDWRDESVSERLEVRHREGAFSRAVWKLKVTPFRQYHVTAKLRARGFDGLPRIVVIGGGRMLNYKHPRVDPDREWTLQHAIFNSLDNEEVRVHLGCWKGKDGEFAWAEPEIREIALFNLVRRPGAPLRVTTEDGKPLEEGRDFEPVADPGLKNIANRKWHQEWHDPPAIRTALPDGTRLRVSYYHALTLYDWGQTMICPSEPRTIELLRDQARRLHAIWNAPAYLMTHDEVRILNWDEACRSRDLTPGQIIADNVATCIKILRETAPGAEILVWSDMWDPFHNAHGRKQYLVRGSMEGTWEGLDRDVIIANWYFDRRDENMRWFASRGHRQLIAGYYDKQPERARDWLESAKNVEGVIGIMYTSWYDNYQDLEAWAGFVDEYR